MFTNTITVVGNPTMVPEVSSEDGKKSWTKFRLLVNRSVRDEHGEYVDAEPLPVVVKAFGRLAENIGERATTKTPLVVVGSERLDTWTDEEGNAHSQRVLYAEEIGISVRY